MLLKQLEPYKGWPLDSETEILMKQIIGALFYEMGFDLNVSLSQIESGDFVDSIVDNEDNFQQLGAPKITEQNATVFRSIRNLLAEDQNLCEYEIDQSHQEYMKNLLQPIDISQYLPKAHNNAFDGFKIQDLQLSLFSGARNDNFDTPLLRYIVARKYQFQDALKMTVDCLNWRVNTHPVDKYLLEADVKMFLDNTRPKLIDTFRMGYVYLRGRDKGGQPIVVVRVKHHFRLNCSDEDFERLICLVIEWVRLQLQESKGINKGTILFDMTGFSLQNADLHAIKFIVTSFEANYPEYLGKVLIHNAPWVFNTVWSLIKTWLDPVVAAKIEFTKGDKLYDFIDENFVPSWLGGKDTYEPTYVPPTEESLSPVKIDDTTIKLLKERHELSLQFIQATVDWVNAKTNQESYNYLIQRLYYQREVSKNYIKLDPRLRSRGPFDRNGQITDIGL